MKQKYSLFSLTLFLMSTTLFSQTFYITKVDTVMYDVPGAEIVFNTKIINTTSSTIYMRVTREQDVIPEAPTWTSAFCMDVCYTPTTDSVSYTFKPMDTVGFTLHMYTTSTPDHANSIMKWRNINNSSNTFYCSYFGSTDGTLAGINKNDNSANISIYPMPIVSGEIFSFNASNIKDKKNMSLEIFNTLGCLVNKSNIIEGINFMSLDLSSGIYSYRLISGNTQINSGKILIK